MRKRTETASKTPTGEPNQPEVSENLDTVEPSVRLTREQVALSLLESKRASFSTGATVGDVLKVTKGKELFAPIKYFSFEVGPLAIETQVREGETIVDTYARACTALEELFEVEFSIKLKAFHDRHEQSMKRVVAS